MVLVDTSVWIDHFRRASPQLVRLLEAGQVLSHPFVIGEIACGSLARRSEILSLLGLLPRISTAEDHEARILLESERLWSKGLGWIDIHLLASTRLDGAHLWTRDKSLATAAADLDIAYRPD